MAFSGLCQDFGGYLNTLNTSWLLPTNWNKRRLKISGTRMPSSPLSLYPQLFPTVHLRQRSSVVQCQLLTTFLQLQNRVSHISATNGCSHWFRSMYQIPFISLQPPVGSVRSSGDFRRPPKLWLPRRQNPSRNDPLCEIRKCLVFITWVTVHRSLRPHRVQFDLRRCVGVQRCYPSDPII